MNSENEKNIINEKDGVKVPEQIFDGNYSRSGEMKKISSKPSAKKKQGPLSERDGDGTREYAMSRYYGYVKAKKRNPRASRFVKGLIIYGVVLFLLILTSAAVLWRYIDLSSGDYPENYMENLVASTDKDGWQQFLRRWFAGSYAEYEKAGELAYQVLSPSFNVVNASFLPLENEGTEDAFMLFSDGVHFADVYFHGIEGGTLGLGTYEIEHVDFDMNYFGIDFPLTTVIIPEGAEYTVNGVANPEPALKAEKTVYPGKSPGETEALACCTTLVFDDLYFVPELTASLDGCALNLVSDEEKRIFWFEYPEKATHSISVTVPAGVSAFVGGTLLDESWASREYISGELGELDDGGTGTLPMLAVWTVKGLFYDTPVAASVGSEELTLKSSDNGNYVFNVPAGCKYTVTILAPAGASVTVNGRTIGNEYLSPEGPTAAELGRGATVLGTYDVTELGAADNAVPDFDKYVLTGYLALPVVTVTYNGNLLTPASSTVTGYRALWEYDLPYADKETYSSAITEGAISFFGDYVEYLCDGGAFGNPGNKETFEKNLESLINVTVSGTSGYMSMLESARSVNMMQPYGAFEIKNTEVTDYIAYTDNCVSCVVRADVVRGDKFETTEKKVLDGNGKVTTVTETTVAGNVSTVSVAMNVLQVVYRGEWRVWGFSCTMLESK